MGPEFRESPCIPWDKLVAWIREQREIESQTGRPAPLTQTQLEAVSALVPFHAESPDVEDADYVSKLMHKTQATRAKSPVFADLQPANVPVGGHMQPRWRCVCTLAQHGSFPREGYGFEHGEEAPVFQSKKTAKQFAAKHALAYLTQGGSLAQTPALSRGSSASEMPCSPATPNISPGAPPASVFHQVSTLSSRLGLETPSYLVEPDADDASFFSARPVFKKASCVPVDMSVSRVQGHKQAKQQAAELVLAWMNSELKKRHDRYQSLWAA